MIALVITLIALCGLVAAALTIALCRMAHEADQALYLHEGEPR